MFDRLFPSYRVVSTPLGRLLVPVEGEGPPGPSAVDAAVTVDPPTGGEIHTGRLLGEAPAATHPVLGPVSRSPGLSVAVEQLRGLRGVLGRSRRRDPRREQLRADVNTLLDETQAEFDRMLAAQLRDNRSHGRPVSAAPVVRGRPAESSPAVIIEPIDAPGAVESPSEQSPSTEPFHDQLTTSADATPTAGKE